VVSKASAEIGCLHRHISPSIRVEQCDYTGRIFLNFIFDVLTNSRITAAEMKYMRRTAGYVWTDYKTNLQIAKELKNNSNFGQITRIQEQLDTTCKQNAS
jgi:hypothetical protein